MLHNNKTTRIIQSRGFTVVELLIVAPIVILVIAGFVGVVITMTGSVLASKGSSTLTYNIQDALNRIEQDTKQSGAFLSTNNISLTSPQGYADDTTNFHNADATNGSSLILNAYATTGNPIGLSAIQPIPAANQPNACSASTALLAQNTLVYINIVYFVRNNTLWRRVVVPSSYPGVGCTAPWQQASCANGYSSTFCKTNDIDLVDNVTTNGFSVSYYPSASSSTATTAASDTSKSDSVRQNALIATNTVGVTISAAQTIAGHAVSQSGTIRATSPNNDLTFTTTVVAPTMTTQPANQSVTAGSTATFTAAAAPATGLSAQWQQSTDSGASWSNISGATSTTLTVATSTVYQNGYQYQVIFSNTTGSVTSSAATLTVTSTGWTTLTLQNGWNTFSTTFNTAAFRQTSSGLIVLKGLDKRTGTAIAGEVIATLPIGYRPSNAIMYGTSSNTATGRIDVWPDGTIRFQAGSAVWVALDGVSFMPSGTTYTPITTQSSWVNYSTAPYSNPLSYYQAADTRVSLRGTISGGTSTDGTAMGTLPSAIRPTYYEQYAQTNNNTAQAIGINVASSGTIQAKGYASNAFVSANALYYPSTYTYTALPLSGAWVAYGGTYSTPRYTKSADGMVLVKGDVKTGAVTSGAAIAQLPSGFRPAVQSIFTVATYNSTTGFAGYGRVDITPAGVVSVGAASSVNNTWVSLDSISFYADGT